MPDYSLLYDPNELERRHKEMEAFSMITEDGKSLNEDFSRYF